MRLGRVQSSKFKVQGDEMTELKDLPQLLPEPRAVARSIDLGVLWPAFASCSLFWAVGLFLKGVGGLSTEEAGSPKIILPWPLGN